MSPGSPQLDSIAASPPPPEPPSPLDDAGVLLLELQADTTANAAGTAASADAKAKILVKRRMVGGRLTHNGAVQESLYRLASTAKNRRKTRVAVMF